MGATEPVGPKRHQSLQATRLIHEHIATIMCFAFSWKPLREMMNKWYEGEWKYLGLALEDIPEQRAERALIELGLYIRVIDEGENLSNHTFFKKWEFGELVQIDGSSVSLVLPREVGNKIIHAERYEWTVSANADESTVTCWANESQRKKYKWSKASINLVPLAGFCGSLMS